MNPHMLTPKQIMNTRLNNLTDEELFNVMQKAKGKKLTHEQKIKFSNHYKKNINTYEK